MGFRHPGFAKLEDEHHDGDYDLPLAQVAGESHLINNVDWPEARLSLMERIYSRTMTRYVSA